MTHNDKILKPSYQQSSEGNSIEDVRAYIKDRLYFAAPESPLIDEAAHPEYAATSNEAFREFEERQKKAEGFQEDDNRYAGPSGGHIICSNPKRDRIFTNVAIGISRDDIFHKYSGIDPTAAPSTLSEEEKKLEAEEYQKYINDFNQYYNEEYREDAERQKAQVIIAARQIGKTETVTMLTEGKMSKGGQNIPTAEELMKRPPAPRGSAVSG